MKLEEREREESRKTKGKSGEEEGDGTKTGAIFPTPSSSSPSTYGDLGHVTKNYLPKPCLLRKKKIKIKRHKQKQTKTNKSTKTTKKPHNHSRSNPVSWSVFHLPPACTKNNWWPQSLYYGRRISAENPRITRGKKSIKFLLTIRKYISLTLARWVC